MLRATDGVRGMVVAPHGLAASSGLAVLREGGNAIEAMVAAAAAIAVVYPHMNGLGGDGFWLIAAPGAAPVGIDACGATGASATPALYAGASAIPARGPLAANTVAGTVSGWKAALAIAAEWGGRMPLERLLEDAAWFAETGFPASDNQAATTALKAEELRSVPGFADAFLIDGTAPTPGGTFRNPALAETLRCLARDGLDEFYRGGLARRITADLDRLGAPVGPDDLARHRALRCAPLSVDLAAGTVFNMPPPTQGVTALMILGLIDRLGLENEEPDGFAHIHAVVEATKRAFVLRNAHLGDPATMEVDACDWLTPGTLDETAREIHRETAAPGRRRCRAATPSGWAPSTAPAGRSASSRASTGSSARALYCRTPG